MQNHVFFLFKYNFVVVNEISTQHQIHVGLRHTKEIEGTFRTKPAVFDTRGIRVFASTARVVLRRDRRFDRKGPKPCVACVSSPSVDRKI